MLKEENLFIKTNFSQVQLDALGQIYAKYFEQLIPEFRGTGFVAFWRKGEVYKTGTGVDAGHGNPGTSIEECDDDVLWQNFSNLLPYMAKSAIISKIPPGKGMVPHVDRKARPEVTIYFPIKGCTSECTSHYYDLPKIDTESAQVTYSNPTPLYTFAVTDNAVMENVREWHSVQNNSQIERVAFGWNMLPEYSFTQAKAILTDLGYII